MILALLRDLRARYGLTIVIVTHDPRVAEQADRVIAIRDGRTSTETVRTTDDDRRQTNDDRCRLRSSSRRSSRRPSSVVEELVVLDSAGRLQLPGDQRALAGIGRRARVELVDGGILIRPTDDDRIEAGRLPMPLRADAGLPEPVQRRPAACAGRTTTRQWRRGGD